MGNKDLGKAIIKPEHNFMLLDPRRKLCTTEECVKGGCRLRDLAKEDVYEVANDRFTNKETTEPTSEPSQSPAPESDVDDGASGQPASQEEASVPAREKVLRPPR